MSNPATNWEDAYRVQTARIAELERENAELRAHAERVGEANDQLAVENASLRATLDAIIAADERAVKLWRAAHPGNELVIPDRGRLVGWLLEQNAALREELDWKTERIKLLSDCLHNIDGLLKKAAKSVFVDALDAARKEAQQ